jgi:hypothetical protein
VTNLTVILREISRYPKNKAKVVFSLRLEEDDVEFLGTLPNASEFIRQAIAEEKRRQKMLESKGLPFEIIHEIAEAFVDWHLKWFKEPDCDLQRVNFMLSDPLFKISELTLTCPMPFSPNGNLSIPHTFELDQLCEDLHSNEAKAFIQKIISKIDYENPCKLIAIGSLDKDELETVRKIYDEAKMLLEQGYRKAFHKLPPADWYLKTYSFNNSLAKMEELSYKLP